MIAGGLGHRPFGKWADDEDELERQAERDQKNVDKKAGR